MLISLGQRWFILLIAAFHGHTRDENPRVCRKKDFFNVLVYITTYIAACYKSYNPTNHLNVTVFVCLDVYYPITQKPLNRFDNNKIYKICDGVGILVKATLYLRKK